MSIRQPVVAGRFYPASSSQAQHDAMQCLTLDEPLPEDLPTSILGAIVPHAGWMCSGAVAGRAIRAMAKSLADKPLETVVLFGAIHWAGVRRAAMYSAGSWKTPLGEVQIDTELAQAILAQGDAIVDAPQAHDREHSIEVVLPLIQALFPGVRIVPIAVPPTEDALAVGRQVASAISTMRRCVVCVGSSDLTHYGPDYQFAPKGTGPDGLRWAKDVNDAAFLQAIEVLDAPRVLKLAANTGCACGAGAVAATIVAAAGLGAMSAVVLQHTTSSEVLADRYGPDMQNSVGYASIVLGR